MMDNVHDADIGLVAWPYSSLSNREFISLAKNLDRTLGSKPVTKSLGSWFWSFVPHMTYHSAGLT